MRMLIDYCPRPWRVMAILGAMAACTAAIPVAAADLQAYTEQWPPYNYVENDRIQGISTDILRAACELANLDCAIQLVPWARGYKIARNTANALLYTTARKPARENQFLWVGPILPRTTWVYTRSEVGKTVTELKDLATVRVGVVREEAAEQDLLAAGVPAGSIHEESSNAVVLRLLLSDLVGAMVDTEVGMAWNLRSLGRPATSVSKQLKLSEDGAYYFALNLKTHPALVQKLQAAVDRLRREGRLDAIVRSYEPSL
jgi:polar amino acid transport system substrate-binding protein